MAREHRKDDKSHRSHEPHESRQSHKSHKSHKPHKIHKVHKSTRDVSASPLSLIKERIQNLPTAQIQNLLTSLEQSAPQSVQKPVTVHQPTESSPKPTRSAQSRHLSKPSKAVSIAGIFKRPNHQPPKKKVVKVREKTQIPT